MEKSQAQLKEDNVRHALLMTDKMQQADQKVCIDESHWDVDVIRLLTSYFAVDELFCG